MIQSGGSEPSKHALGSSNEVLEKNGGNPNNTYYTEGRTFLYKTAVCRDFEKRVEQGAKPGGLMSRKARPIEPKSKPRYALCIILNRGLPLDGKEV
ncbi:hypothetical protein LQV63_08990 [Paenibacillus profundus]|uniref:Uncharacterized protein n=1 Tax=Paenibacillus profundus TaxID=1173085 RepID=A0ABS8YBQ9_9BACL|nr:hypothetical protein [Paenibacillus profundus]